MFKGLIFTLIFSQAALAKDPCLAVIESTHLSQIRELSPSEYLKLYPVPESPKYGRFFTAKNHRRKKIGVWAIPYAQGKACVVRDITRL